jgi:hypothetical protein
MSRDCGKAAPYPQQGGTEAMAGEGAKMRFAIGIFEDLASLTRAAEALIGVGLDTSDICVAARRAALSDAPADLRSVAGQGSQVVWFQYGSPALIAPPQGWFPTNAAPLISSVGTSRPHHSPLSDIWSTIDIELAKGALLLVARLPSTSLQDQAVRALLRYSRHPVHAEEFFSPAVAN